MQIFTEFRKNEWIALLYRILLAYFFYQIVRFLFWFFNRDIIDVDGFIDYISLSYYGIAFDTTAILYTNALFILLSSIPVIINTKKGYQKLLFWVYFVCNGLAMAINFVDIVYYRFSQTRLTSAVFQVAEHENNIGKIFLAAIWQHPLVFLLYFLLILLWVFLYIKVKVPTNLPQKRVPYFLWSTISLCLIVLLSVGGIRGDFKHSTRPINLVDANRHVKNATQANIVLNSTFSFFRTLGKTSFKEVHFVDEHFIETEIKPYKKYNRTVIQPPPNIVIFIVESFGREYSGAFNQNTKIQDYVSYTPFVDSLAKESLIFPNMFANGRQSIHGMSSVLAGIPSLTDAFTSSPYANQKIQSIVSVCNEMGYDTSFYHGAPNGSMGFLGFGNILGFKHYYGKTEYHNDQDFDGIWSIWDEPFLQYFAKNTGKSQPFMATVFTASSHDPFKIPEKYAGKFRKGNLPIHEPIQYTDYSLRQYFATAKKQPWYYNTIFVITGDHTNQTFYPEYNKAVNRFAIPLLLYSPNPAYQLKGVDLQFAQQIDIYPTLADLIGYHKNIRSWGKSLLSDEQYPTIVVNSNGILDNFLIGNYRYTFDGKNIVGIYQNQDLNMENNLIKTIQSVETEKGKQLAKAWYQDYMDRVIHKKLQ